MLRLVNQTQTDGRGVPLLFGALFSTGISLILWSVLWAGVSALR